MQSENNFSRWRKDQRGDAVVRLHAAKGRVVSGVPDRIDRKVLILDLGLLQTHHVGFVLGDPAEDDRQAPADGVYVVGGDFHCDGRPGAYDAMPWPKDQSSFAHSTRLMSTS